jgi:DNA repair protein RadC
MRFFTPREVFRNAIHLGASCIILVHNHPSGSLIPNRPDINVTNELVEARKILKIEVIDHVIVFSEGHSSPMKGCLIRKNNRIVHHFS